MARETELERMVIRLIGDATSYKAMMEEAREQTKQLKQTVQDSSARMGSDFKSLFSKLAAMVSGGLLVRWGLQNAIAFEQTRIAFETMIGSANEARKTMDDLTRFAAETPFQMPQIEQAARGLIMFGERGEELMDTLRILGNAAAGTSTDFGYLALVYNQVRGVGRLLSQDFRQLAMRGVISLRDIADYFGVSTEAAQRMMSAGKIGFEDLRNILKGLTSEGGRFANMMEKQSRSLGGVWSTLKDNLGILLRTITEQFVPGLIRTVRWLIGAANSVTEFVKRNSDAITSLVKLGAAMAAAAVTIKAMNLILKAYNAYQKTTITLQAILQAVAGPAGWAALAAGIAVAGVTLVSLNALFAQTEDVSRDTVANIRNLGSASPEIERLAGPIASLAENLESGAASSLKLAESINTLRARLTEYEDVWHRQYDPAAPLMRRLEEVARLEDVQVETQRRIEDLAFALRQFGGDEAAAAKALAEFRKELSGLHSDAEKLTELRNQLEAFVRLGEITEEEARKIYERTWEKTSYGQAAAELRRLAEENRALALGWDENRIAWEKFRDSMKGLPPRAMESLREQYRLNVKLREEREKERQRESRAKELIEKFRTPREKYEEEMRELTSLRKEWETSFGLRGIDEATFQRAAEEARKLLEREGVGKVDLSPRFDAAAWDSAEALSRMQEYLESRGGKKTPLGVMLSGGPVAAQAVSPAGVPPIGADAGKIVDYLAQLVELARQYWEGTPVKLETASLS